MMNNTHNNAFSETTDGEISPAKKSIYDSIKVSKKGLDITIFAVCTALVILFIIALLK